MHIKDIIAIIIGIIICAGLCFLALTVSHWWEWIFIVAIIICFGLQVRSYLIER